MKFEDDEYWEAEYHDKSTISYVDDGATARDPYAARRPPPPAEPMPTRRPASARVTWDGDFDEPPAPGGGVDELAVRRQRRGSGNSRPPVRERRPLAAFDSERPGWLDDPDFVPPDVSGPDLAGPESAVLDFNRPELGADFDAPEFGVTPSTTRRAARPSRGAARSLEEQFAAGELDYGDLEYDEEDYLRDLDQARGGGRVDDSGRVARVRRVDGPDRGRARPSSPADDDGLGGAIRPPGGRRPRRTAEPGRYAPGREPREDDRPRFAEPAASGRARVPEPADFDFDDLRTVSGRASVDSEVAAHDDVLDVYRPRRDVPGAAGPRRAGPLDDEFYREPLGNRPYRGEAARADEALDEESRRARRRPAARAETDPRTDQRRPGESRPRDSWAGGDSWAGDRRDAESWTADGDDRSFPDRRPAADLDDPDRRRTPAPSGDGDQADRRPAADLDRGQRGPDETGRPDAAGDSAVPDADQPRVLSKSTAPTTPRVIHKAAPPAAPKVIKKVEPPATPKVIKKVEPAAPARVVKPAPPTVPAAAAASAPTPVAPSPAEVARPRSAPPADPPRAAPISPAAGPGVARPDAAAQGAAAPGDESSWVTAERPIVQRPQAMPPAAAGALPQNGDRQAPIRPQPVPPAAGDAGLGDDSWQRIDRPGAPRLQGIPSDAAFPPATAPQHGVRFRPGVRPAPAQRPASPAATGAPPAPAAAPTAPQARPAAQAPVGPMAPPAAGTRPASGPPAAGVAPVHQEPGLRQGGWLAEGQRPAAAVPAAPAPVVPAPAVPLPQVPGQRTEAIRHPAPAPAPAPAPQAPHAPVSPATPPNPVPHALPSGQAPAPQPHAVTPAATPPQVHPRVEPTPINGYPGAHVDRHGTDVRAPYAPPPAATPGQPAAAPPGRSPSQHRAAAAAPATGLPAPATPPQTRDHAAAPVPDPDPSPIGQLRTPGPDAAPRQYSDAGLGAWFSAKPSATGETDVTDAAKTSEPAPTAAANTADGSATAGAHAASDRAETAPPGAPGADSQTPAGVQNRAGSGAPESATSTVDGRPDAEPATDATGSGVVLDFDITGLLNGSGATAEQPIIVARREPSTPDQTSAPAEPEAQPEPAEAEAPVRPLRSLAAADLDAIRWRLDGGTLREVVDNRDALRELGAKLDEPLAGEADNISRSGLLSVRAEVYRLLDELGMAAAASRLALSHAESAGDVQSIVIAQAELAHVLRLRGDFGEADRLFEEAASSDSPEVLRSIVHENAGRSCFDQGRHMEALDHFTRAIRLGRPDDLDLVERIDVSLEAVYIHVLRDGWGPYPRLRRDILDPPRRGATPQPSAAR